MPSINPKGFFITGTDTNVGKTTITRMLISEFISQGYTTIGCKPVSCCDPQDNSHDGLTFLEINSLNLPLNVINPLRFNLPVSPNIAAKHFGKSIALQCVMTHLQSLYSLPLDYIFFEGIGGWQVPLNNQETMADLAKALQVPVVLVVPIKVGCLNHALLTCKALRADNVPVLGWIANLVDEKTPAIQEHIETLQHWLKMPHIGTVPFQSDLQDPTWRIDLAPFLTDQNI
jgi:dethiobiotin synthetase